MERHIVAIAFWSAALVPPLRAQLVRTTSYLAGRLESDGDLHVLTAEVVAHSAEDARVYVRQIINRFADDAAINDLRFSE
jgi:hypothetical protein